MWDSFLILISQNPFFASLSPSVFCLFIWKFLKITKNSKFLLSTSILLTLAITCILHTRWDSFSIHFFNQKKHHIQQKNILFIGDSITCEGVRPRGFITKIKAVLPVGADVLCLKGATTEKIIKLVQSAEIKDRPDLIIAQSGINDILSGVSEEDTKLSQKNLITRITNHFPNSQLFFFPIHPILHEGKLLQIKGTAFPSTSSSMWNDVLCFQNKYLVADGIHLNAKGHTLLATKILNHFSKSQNNAS